MKKVFNLLLILFPLFLIAEEAPQEKEKYDFRQTVWGMSQREVRVSEKKRKPILEPTKKTVSYLDTIISLNMSVMVTYFFIDNKLVTAGYWVIKEHSNKNLYIDDYKELKSVLVEKYGEPSDKWIDGSDYKEIVWLNDLYKNDPSSWGFAISVGDLVYQSCWEIDKTEIIMRLSGDNYEINLLIKYLSKELKYLEEKEKGKMKKEKF